MGPWRIEEAREFEEGGTRHLPARIRYYAILDTDNNIVASARGIDASRLIAAAPELLEALERFLDWPGRFTGGERAEDYAFARRTLAKARAPRAAGYEVTK